ncbi:DMT family transporter [Bradyrhizobium neotropicale]|uniref:DMT family transporter n=1 Tax=Bradyrhizobium neotropicale TaxID=1497615 RepID=UPI001AD790EE|nr:DMT family transporter [Bradyrhizobium neotropicale]MBO4223594.1 EamA family transporter [Bradyrhizobium neotropicale]
MDTTAALLMLLAGALHAAWHVLVKGASTPPLLAGMGLVSSSFVVPLLFVVPSPPPSLWPIYLLSISLHIGYKLFLGLAYEQGDLSKVYPLIRALVPICATLLSYLESGQLPNTGQLIGIALVSVGALGLISGELLSVVRLRLPLISLATSAMIAAYSVVDAYGARSPIGWFSFTIWLIFLDGLAFAAVAQLVQGNALWSQLSKFRLRTVVASALGTGSFAVFVWALSLSPVAVVAAFRECGVIFAALLGFLVLKEPFRLGKWLAVGTIAVGLVVIAGQR